MIGFLNPVGGKASAPLGNRAAADHFWRSLPRNDAVGAQRAVCDALSDLETARGATVEQLRALLALDRHARKLTNALLVGYIGRDAQSQSLEKRYGKAACDLSHSFGLAYGGFLRHLRESAPQRVWNEHVPAVLLGMFRHRQVELLLRPYQGGEALATGWPDLHEAYQFAHSRGLLERPMAIRRVHQTEETNTTLGQEYVRILLLDLMNGGQFSPYDTFRADQYMTRWCEVLTLESPSARSAARSGSHCFFVDTDSTAGLQRSSAEAGGACLCLDTSPMLALIDERIAELCDAADHGKGPGSFGRGRELRLLRKLKLIYFPTQPRISRRGERRNLALNVQVVVGLKQIVRTLRDKWRRDALDASTEVPEVEEITITAYGGYTVAPSGFPYGGDGPITLGSAGKLAVSHPVWQLLDCSESGCRLHGVVPDLKGVVTGALLAFREREGVPWTLAVVRRLKKLVGNHVDMGVEYVGQDPRCVRLAVVDDRDARRRELADERGRSFAGLYLPESPRHPRMPFKTLIVPAQAFGDDCCLSLSTAEADYTIRPKEPIEEQGEFIWLPYQVIDRRVADCPAQDQVAA